MTAIAASVEAHCPLCGELILSFGRSGRVRSATYHLLPLYRRSGAGEGFAVCDDCGHLASSTELPLN